MTCVLNPPCLACLTDTNTLLTAELARVAARAERAEQDADDLAEYARHAEGCNGPYGYRCKCGVDKYLTVHREAVAQRGTT